MDKSLALYFNEKCIINHKDTQFAYTDCNQGLLHYAGYKDKDKILGLKDFDFPWRKYTDIYREHDKDTLAGQHYSLIIPLVDAAGNESYFLNNKIQLTDANGKILGLTSFAMEIINPELLKFFHTLNNSSLYPKNNCFYFNKQHQDISLTSRENECLYYLLRGCTSKMIGRALGLSPRTVEHYIEQIKIKFGCTSKTELIERAIAHGLSQFIPSSLSLEKLALPVD